jgi:hypothetical protein
VPEALAVVQKSVPIFAVAQTMCAIHVKNPRQP